MEPKKKKGGIFTGMGEPSLRERDTQQKSYMAAPVSHGGTERARGLNMVVPTELQHLAVVFPWPDPSGSQSQGSWLIRLRGRTLGESDSG